MQLRWQTLLLLFAVLLLGVGLTLIAYYQFYLVEYHTIPVDFKVARGVGGLDADTDALHFGTLTPGGLGKRNMLVTPARDARLVVSFSGQAAPFMTVQPDNVRVEKGVPLRLNFTLAMPANATPGNYTGEARFYFYR